jgi:AraC-like DNA-binding protein
MSPITESFNLVTFALLIAALGQIVFVLSMLLTRLKVAAVYTPLVIFFIASGCSYTLPALNNIWPEFTIYAIFISLPCFSLQPVALWLYVVGLTSPTRWQFSWRYWRHFIPAFLGLLLSLFIVVLPESIIKPIFIDGQDPTSSMGIFVVVAFFVLLLLFLVQSSLYLVFVVKRLLRYQQQLKLLFSSNEQRELFWVLWLVLIIAGTWITTLAYILPVMINEHALFGDEVIAACYLALVWTIGLWGLRQKPGFHGRYLTADNNQQLEQSLEEVLLPSKKKYKKSALDLAQSERIAKKLEAAMQNQQLYLQPDLSLPSLAKQIQVPANYLSQTLNENLKESFFDYVNRWRVEHAKGILMQGTQTILDIAMESGFNAKSSFYKAFKQMTGQTPGQYGK